MPGRAMHASLLAALREELRRGREAVGDTGDDFPAMRQVIEEFWDHDEADRARAVEISREYVTREAKGKK